MEGVGKEELVDSPALTNGMGLKIVFVVVVVVVAVAGEGT